MSLILSGFTISAQNDLPSKYIGCSYRIGGGSEFYTGEASSFLGPRYGVSMGGDIVINRLNIMIDGTFCKSLALKQDFANFDNWYYSGTRAISNNFELSLGYTAYDSRQLRIIPFAGAGLATLFYDKVKTEEESTVVQWNRFHGGIATDFKIHSLSDKSTILEPGIRTRLYVAYHDFPFMDSSLSINFSISVSLHLLTHNLL